MWTLKICSFLCIHYTTIKLKKKILLTDVLETNWGAEGGEESQGGAGRGGSVCHNSGKTMRGGLSDDLTCELRPATSARTSCGHSGPLPFHDGTTSGLNYTIFLARTTAVLCLYWLHTVYLPSVLTCHPSPMPTSCLWRRDSSSRRVTFNSPIWSPSHHLAKLTEVLVRWALQLAPIPRQDIQEGCGSLSEHKAKGLPVFKTLLKNSPHLIWIIVVFQSLCKVICKETKLFYQADRYSKLLVLNKHGNTSVKSNKFKLNEISICLQCISLWHFLYCHGALIKFFKMQRKYL